MNIPATITDSIRTADPGAIKFNGGVILFNCPCGCGNRGQLPLRDKSGQRPSWLWDGDRERPTLTPSVHCTGFPCGWHGWLQAGEWVSV